VLLFLARMSAWALLARHYPLADEWPDLTCPGTMVAADPLPYRVTVGANSRGITFHGYFLRLVRSAVFVPWSEVSATPGPSQLFRHGIRLRFQKVPSLRVTLPEEVWANLAGQRPLSTQPSVGV
jgi:hypothetical protein